MAAVARQTPNDRAPVVLVFGEHTNDSRSVARLIEALCPELQGRVKARSAPPSLQRSASPRAVHAWTDRIADVVRTNRQPVACVFVHRDSDAPDPTGRLQSETEAALRAAGMADAHAVVPVEEIESWWMLFPEAAEEVRSSWRGLLDRSPADRDAVQGPKEALRRRTGRANRRDAYSAADSPRVAGRVAAALEAGTQPTGQSRSFDRFRDSVAECCEQVVSDG